MPFRYAPFNASKQLDAAARNAPPLRRGARGDGVALLQGGLVSLGFPLPRTMSKGAPDGVYGSETFAAVQAFQRKKKGKLEDDGVAGRNTLAALDADLSAKFPKAPPPVPAPQPSPQTSQYELGTSDPPIKPDPGAGHWNTKPKQPAYYALKGSILNVLPTAAFVIGDDAAMHMLHYLNNSGKPLHIDLQGMIDEVPRARRRFEAEVAQAKAFVEQLPTGRHAIRSRRLDHDYNYQSESKNWFYAIGGYSVWGTGVAEVRGQASSREYVLDFAFKFFDRYNWDNGKKVEIFGITITDYFMGEFHRQGLAQEFDCHGSIRRRFTWTHGTAIPKVQLDAPSEPRT